MRLTNIKLAGFKSFVDPTNVALPGNLVAVVGPNGCGKSNIIDAVRWVMGESSAKQLRGESMADVIFNGSSTRQPVGKAAIELQFDNSDGSLGGQYAQYAEIAIRREVTRDGQSNYYLNGARCRRRDITDIFLGTGLGPRSYAIIEQGMINRLVDAKPDELRIYIEEAAGISKYKERRRETELRMQHTRDNLLRLNDLRDELGRQLEQLQRQSETAKKYQELKQQERELQLQLQALRWQSLQHQLTEQETQLTQQEVQLEALLAEQRALETLWLQGREQHTIANTQVDTVQAEYYKLGAEIARLEQSLQHQQERRQQLDIDLQEATQAWQFAQQSLQTDTLALATIATDLAALQPQLSQQQADVATTQTLLTAAEQNTQQLQTQTEEINQQSANYTQQASAEQARIQQLEQRLQQTEQHRQRLESELTTLQPQDLEQTIAELITKEQQLKSQLVQTQTALTETVEQIRQQREHNQQTQNQAQQQRGELQQLQGRQSGLLALQQTALGKTKTPTQQWLMQQQLEQAPRLAQQLNVTPGWERAVEVVLADALEAVCVDDLQPLSQTIDHLQDANLSLFTGKAVANTAHTLNSATLLSKIASPWQQISWLAGIYAVENLTEALQLLPQLASHESVITCAGEWLGPDWLKVRQGKDEHTGILQRERELSELEQQIQQCVQQLDEIQLQVKQGQQQLQQLENTREQQQQAVNQLTSETTQFTAQLQVKQHQLDQLRTRQQQINTELTQLHAQQVQHQQALIESRQQWQLALQHTEQQASVRSSLLQQRDAARAELEQLRQQLRQQETALQQTQLRQQTLQTQHTGMQQNISRLQTDLEKLAQRQQQLQQTLTEVIAPLANMQQQLDQQLQQRLQVEQNLTAARQQLQALEAQQRDLEQQRQQFEQQHNQLRDQLEQQRIQAQTLRVRRDDLQQQVAATGEDIASVCLILPAEAEEAIWDEQVSRLKNRIERLGPINLMAISEYQTQAERKTYLDAQDLDLRTALETLEQAIRTIDQETRARFQETFDQVNAHFQQLFPRVFGGGRAVLELLGEDLLDTGVSIMAQPPGKRNSTIHLLSGGEKALTAVALVFAIFQLNPAPFCMLDEVDAPLDDANVGRYCELVKELSKQIQFIFITHNKLAMEMAEQLTGVTMKEPGVSRLVAVDIDAALAMADA